MIQNNLKESIFKFIKQRWEVDVYGLTFIRFFTHQSSLAVHDTFLGFSKRVIDNYVPKLFCLKVEHRPTAPFGENRAVEFYYRCFGVHVGTKCQNLFDCVRLWHHKDLKRTIFCCEMSSFLIKIFFALIIFRMKGLFYDC